MSARPPAPTAQAEAPGAPGHPTRSLPHIPIEVLRLVAVHLDTPSGLALTRTCKALRDAGETKVWESISLTSGYNRCFTSMKGRRGWVGICESAEGKEDKWVPRTARFELFRAMTQNDVLSLQDYADRQRSVADQLANIHASLRAYPFRAECIRELRLEVSDDTDNALGKSLFNLLEIVRPHLARLDLVCMPVHPEDELFMGEDDYKLRNSDGFYSLVIHSLETFHRVRQLGIAVPYTQTFHMAAFLAKFPQITHLHVCSADEDFTEDGSALDGPPIPLPHLAQLTFAHLQDENYSVLLLSQLLLGAPKLDTVRLLASWYPSKRDKALAALSAHKNIKTLILLSTDGMDYDRLGRVPLNIEEILVEDAVMEESGELCFENLTFPRLPHTKRMTILTGPRMPADEYVSLGLGPTRHDSAQPVECGHVSSLFVRYLRRVPHLEWIQLHFEEEPYPSIYRPSREPEYFVPPDRWESEGHRGAVIRRYISPGGDDDFWHIRAISRALDHPSGPAFVGPRRSWRDFTHYRGRTVPWRVMQAVYAAAGQDARWIDGGRNMRLGVGEGLGLRGDKAWAVLREWRAEVGDESDIEEFVDGDGEGEERSSDGQWTETEDGDGDGDDSDADQNALIEILEGAGLGGSDDGWETDGDESDDPLGEWN